MTHRLLLVEDSPLQAEVLREDLSASGYHVDVARTGEEALAHLRVQRPDAIVSDVMMPGMTGYELCRRVKSDPELADIPVVLLTSLRDPVDIVRGLECGADNFLNKPYDLDQLLQRLQAVLRRRDRGAVDRSETGVDVLLLGHTFTVDADRQQILDMLMSSFEDLIHTNDRLRAREHDLQQARDELVSQVTVSEQRRVALQKNKAELRRTLEHSGVATWRLFLPEGRFEWSENARALHGLAPDAPIHHVDEWLARVHPDDRPALAALGEGMAGSSGTELPDEWEYRIVGSDGETRWFSGRGEIEARGDGGVVVTGVAIDVSHRRGLEEELRLREQTLSAVLSASPDAILVIGSEGRIEFASHRVRDIIGRDAEELLGRSPRAFLTEESVPAIYLGGDAVRLRGGEARDSLRVAVRHVDGHLVTVDARIGELRDDEGNVDGYVAVMRDVTEQARLERELEEAKEEADAANRAKSEYLSRMSHELRTPMNTVLGFSQLLQLSDLDPEDEENVGRILRAGRHLLRLIDDVLDIARIESGGMPFSLEPVAVGRIVADAVELIQRQAEERRLTVRVSDDCGDGMYVLADPQRFSQVVINLLSNAVKYNRPGGEIRVDCGGEIGGRRRIAVSDTGYGLTAEEAGRVFTPFDRLDADQGQVTGTGLGLALSRHLAEAMGGTMGCHSRKGEGSTFWVELPAAPIPRGVHQEIEEGPVERDAPLVGTVLYIEDNPLNVELVRQSFASAPGIELLHAPSGEEGLALATERPPGLVLLDLHLPGVTGREVLERLRMQEATRDVPVVIVSADATSTSTDELLSSGADDYLSKPFDLAELREVVARMLAG